MNTAQNQPTHDPVVTKFQKAGLSMNHTMDELEAEHATQQIAEVDEPRQRSDGMWDCAHKCKNKQT